MFLGVSLAVDRNCYYTLSSAKKRLSFFARPRLDMSRQRAIGDPVTTRGVSSSSSDAALRTTQLVQQLARRLISERPGRGGPQFTPSEAQVHGAVRLCIRILTSHIGEPLMMDDEASAAQAIRTKLAKVRRHHSCGLFLDHVALCAV